MENDFKQMIMEIVFISKYMLHKKNRSNVIKSKNNADHLTNRNRHDHLRNFYRVDKPILF